MTDENDLARMNAAGHALLEDGRLAEVFIRLRASPPKAMTQEEVDGLIRLAELGEEFARMLLQEELEEDA